MDTIISFSGGMDSATLLGVAKNQGKEILAVGFTYGSKHNQYENAAAKAICDYYQVSLRMIDLSHIMSGFKSNLLKTGGDIPEGHYEDKSMSLTVVPGRNTIFAGILLGIAQSENASEVWLGIHSGDHAIYPDCRPGWYYGMASVYRMASESKVFLMAPFLSSDKAGILQVGLPAGVPYHLTRTCYKDSPIACGRCGSCQERLAAFAAVGRDDPIAYESREILPK